MASENTRPLTAKQQAFVREYLTDMNATQAAIRAGFSAKRASEIGWQLLQKTTVKAALRAAQEDLAAAAGLNQVMVLQELKRIAFADLRDFVDWGPHGVRLRDSEFVDGRAVVEVSETVTEAGGSKKIKLHDKLAAIQHINKMLGWNAPEKLEHTGANGGPIEVEVNDAKQRLAQRLTRLNRAADSSDPRGADGRGS